MNDKPEIMIFMKQKGGVGATDLVAKIAGAYELSGKKVTVLDADNGLRSYKIRHGFDSAKSIPPSGMPDADTYLSSIVQKSDVTLIDVPGAFATRQDAYAQWMWRLFDGHSAQALSRTFFFLAASNAPGSLENAVEMSKTFKLRGRQVLVLNDLSGSGQFGHTPAPAGMETLLVPKVDPGIVAALQRWPQTVSEFIRRPERGFHRASSILAAHVADLATDPTEASRVFRRLLNVRRSFPYEQDIEQICA